MNDKKSRKLSRREFAQRAALLSASASLVPANVMIPDSLRTLDDQPAAAGPQLSANSQAEANSRYQQLLDLYGKRFDEQQKMDLKRMCAELQPSLERVRSFSLQNGDAPALYLKPLVERDKRAKPAGTKKPS